MAQYDITDHEKNIVYRSLIFQRQDLKRQLDDLDAVINKYRGENQTSTTPAITSLTKVRAAQGDGDIQGKVIEALTNADTFLTSRQILNSIKERYIEVKEMDSAADRKYMANVSAILTTKIKQGIVDRVKDDGKDAVYFIKNGQQSVAH